MTKQRSNKKNSRTSPQDYITNWLKTFVEVPHPVFGNMPPCPFAQKARLDGKILFREIQDEEPDSNCWTWIDRHDFGKYEVLCMILPGTRWKPDYTKKIATQLNSVYMNKDIVVLEDHPKIKEVIKGVSLSNGRYILLLAQRLSKLNRFSKQLTNTKYYKNWTKKHLADVVKWRDQKSS